MLGLFIAYDSYKNEIIDNISYTKGGDGGCSLCGGDGAIYVLPCYTAFYREPADERHSGLSKNYFCYRRIIGCRNRFDLADESCRPDEMARTGR